MKRREYFSGYGFDPDGYTLHVRYDPKYKVPDNMPSGSAGYRCTFRNKDANRSMVFYFHRGPGLDNLVNAPRNISLLSKLTEMLEMCMNDILSAIDIAGFDEFCNEYGYDTDSLKAHKIYTKLLRDQDTLFNVLGPCTKSFMELEKTFKTQYQDPNFFPDIKSSYNKHLAVMINIILEKVTFVVGKDETVFNVKEYHPDLNPWLDEDL